MSEKYSVLIKYKYLDYIDNARLSDADTGKFLRGIIEYDKTAEVPEFENPVLTAMFAIVKCDIDENREKWEGTISRNQENGKKGGRPKKNPENPGEPKKPNRFSETQKTHENPKNPQKPKKPDHGYGGDHDLDYEKDHGGDGDPQREETSPGEKSPPPPLSFEHIKKQAVSTDFVLDDQDAKKLLSCTDPAWFGDHSFISFVAQKVREKYENKSAEEQRRIFRTVLFTAENYREEFPLWMEKCEEQDRKEAAKQEKERIMHNAPIKCQCGADLGENHKCPQCEGMYWFDEHEWKWVFRDPKNAINLAEMFRRVGQEKKAEKVSS